MGKYVIRRILQGFLTMLMVSLLIFMILRIAPGDVALMIYTQGDESIQEIDPVALEKIRENLGLNEPLPVQYFHWMIDLATMNWGESYFSGSSVFHDFKRKLPVTLELGILSVLISTFMGIPLGILMAVRQDKVSDYVGRIFSLGGLSIPNFWIATMLMIIGLYVFNWSPPLEYKGITEDPIANLTMLWWPAIIVGYSSAATKARMMRSSMLEVLRQDYVRTARSKGLSPMIVTYRHAMANALLPVVTVIGVSFAVIISGSVIMENIFQLPGLGQYLISAMNDRDYNVVQSLVTFFSVWIILTNLLVDISYAWLDPRIRYD
jgi:peptide/nickel transport system permease protein